MDTYSRNYLIALGTVLVLVTLLWLVSRDNGADALNDMLRADATVAAYPYQFRVRAVHDRVAEMYTPRSAELSALRFIGIVKPELLGASPNDPQMIAAQQELASVQEYAKQLVLARADIDRVVWVADEAWYRRRGITP